jgi:SAM-dependent methyltransferase
MDELALLIDLHRDGERQGPGSEDVTRQAIGLAGLDRTRPLTIADLGCGTGAASLVLARELDAHISAVDLSPDLLMTLTERARGQGLAGRITPIEASMDALPFDDETFDVLWSEAAVYSIGFAAGVTAWQRLLRPGGVLVVSELIWLTSTPPEEARLHWAHEYPQMGTGAERMADLERAGYAPVGFFVLPRSCWTERYYGPIAARIEAFLARHGHSAAAQAVVEAERTEAALYERYGAHYGYGMFIAVRPGS